MIDAYIDPKDIERIKSKLFRVSPAKQGPALISGFRQAALLLEKQLRVNTVGKYLKRGSGRLSNSISSRIVFGKDFQAEIGSGVGRGGRVKYANMQEKGGTIRPKNVKCLTIPLKANLTSAGDTRYSAPELINQFPTFTDKGVMFMKKGKKAIPMFALKKRVNVPASHYLSRTARDMQAKVTRSILAGIEKGLNQ